MEHPSKRILSSFLFAGTLTALGCSAESADPEDRELDLEADEADEADDLEAPDELVSDEDEARSSGGGGHCGGGGDGCGGGCDDQCCDDQCCDDDEPPDLTCEPIELWPPNHQYVTIDLEDCITDVDECDPDWWAEIKWVSSDEEENGQGDGNTEDDIVCVDDDTVKVRRERKGNGDGRVYTVRFEAKDHSGNKKQYSCEVVVPHDQGQGDQAVNSGQAYRVYC
jgi:hypothetical protein